MKTLRPGNPILFVFAIVLIFSTAAGDDARSCQRSVAVRKAQREYYAGAAERALERAATDRGAAQRIDWKAYDAARHAVVVNHPLDCSLPLPDTH